MSGRLFICATPIGNLEDVSHRLLRVLAEVDVIAAEDTRRTRKLLSRYGIRGRLVSYHSGNERTQTTRLVERLRKGDDVALVTDSGTPAISDPGYLLIRACIESNIPIEMVPGPSAAVAALAVSGLPTDRFAFEGFLPRRAGERRRRLESLAADPRTLVFFEAPTRVASTLEELLGVFGDRRIALARELTKVHEEVVRDTISGVLAGLSRTSLVGEFVVVVEGARPSGNLEAAVIEAKRLLASGVPRSRAAAEAAKRFGVARARVYESLAGYPGENGSQL